MKYIGLSLLALVPTASLHSSPQTRDCSLSKGQLQQLLELSDDKNSNVKVLGQVSRGILVEEPVDYSKITDKDFYCGVTHTVTITPAGKVTETTDKDIEEFTKSKSCTYNPICNYTVQNVLGRSGF
jgi:hypothetical protein